MVIFLFVQSPVVAEAAAPEPVMMDQDPPIDPSVETAPRREPALPVSTMTGQASAGHVTNTPQLDSAAPGLTQELTPVSFPYLSFHSVNICLVTSSPGACLYCAGIDVHTVLVLMFILCWYCCKFSMSCWRYGAAGSLWYDLASCPNCVLWLV